MLSSPIRFRSAGAAPPPAGSAGASACGACLKSPAPRSFLRFFLRSPPPPLIILSKAAALPPPPPSTASAPPPLRGGGGGGGATSSEDGGGLDGGASAGLDLGVGAAAAAGGGGAVARRQRKGKHQSKPAKQLAARYSELHQREERERKLAQCVQRLATERALLGKGRRKKLQSKSGQPRQFKWRQERKR
mmetsp:Transcript_25002/g.73167  ORF Transcript_25002/g.73167 Transcript_25002/m.73167 type:complete len:190 (+) Transcript_25002:184-753(+)